MNVSHNPSIVVFDIGEVLLDWDPRHLYRKIFTDPDQMEWFLREVCTPEWNREQDGGRLWTEAVAERITLFPDYAETIRAFDERWAETVSEAVHGSVTLLEKLRAANVPNYAITNFSEEKFVIAQKLFPFLAQFDGIVVSGTEKLLKPDPRIYRLLLDRHELNAADCLFIDDIKANVEAARTIGMQAVQFTDPAQLATDLRTYGFRV